MDAPALIRVDAWQPVGSPFSLKLARVVAGSLLLLLALAALLICVRRTTGALSGALPDGVLVLCGGFLTLSALAFRGLWVDALPAKSRLGEIAHWAAPSVVILLGTCGLSSSENSIAGLVALWGMLALEEAWSWRWFMQRIARPARQLAIASHRTTEPVLAPSMAAESNGEVFESDLSTELDEQVSQKFVRHRTESGGEAMDGWVRVEFAPGQRHANAHIAICPPFARLPQCFVEQMDGPSAEITVAQVLPYGVRCEIKLDEPVAEAERVTVEFSIQEDPAGD